MWKPTSITGGHRSIFSCQVASASGIDCPGVCRQKSMCDVVPPNAAETVPEVKSSQVTVPPKGISMCVRGSIAPGITYLPAASITRSAEPFSEVPTRGDRLPLDQHVRHVVIHGGNDAPAFDQPAHHATAEPWNCGLTSPP